MLRFIFLQNHTINEEIDFWGGIGGGGIPQFKKKIPPRICQLNIHNKFQNDWIIIESARSGELKLRGFRRGGGGGGVPQFQKFENQPQGICQLNIQQDRIINEGARSRELKCIKMKDEKIKKPILGSF